MLAKLREQALAQDRVSTASETIPQEPSSQRGGEDFTKSRLPQAPASQSDVADPAVPEASPQEHVSQSETATDREPPVPQEPMSQSDIADKSVPSTDKIPTPDPVPNTDEDPVADEDPNASSVPEGTVLINGVPVFKVQPLNSLPLDLSSQDPLKGHQDSTSNPNVDREQKGKLDDIPEVLSDSDSDNDEDEDPLFTETLKKSKQSTHGSSSRFMADNMSFENSVREHEWQHGRASPLEPMAFHSSLYHAKRAYASISNPDVQILLKASILMNKGFKSDIERLKTDTEKLGQKVDAAAAHFPTSIFHKRLESMEPKVSSLESKLDLLISLYNADVKKGENVQSTKCKDNPESVRKDDDNTDNDGNPDRNITSRGGASDAARPATTSDKSTHRSGQSTQASDKGKTVQMMDTQFCQHQILTESNPDDDTDTGKSSWSHGSPITVAGASYY